jgi:hypothetical protein
MQGETVSSSLAATKLNSTNLKQPITVHLTNRLSVRLYEDSRPQCLETASLQKGLVLMLDNQEVIEEGMGFGLPIAKYHDKTYFSSTANVSIQKNQSTYIIKKRFVLDAISRKKFWRATYIDDDVYSLVRKTFAKLYLKHKNISPFFNSIMELRNVAKIQTEFQKVKRRGNVTVTYEIQPENINVNADFSDLTLEGCEEVLVLNEQGADVFDRYADSNGLELVGGKIGGWDPVTANQAFMLSSEKQISFCLKKNSGAGLFRGWENTKRRFSWVGLNYSLSPSRGIFDYSIGFNFDKKRNT